MGKRLLLVAAIGLALSLITLLVEQPYFYPCADVHAYQVCTGSSFGPVSMTDHGFPMAEVTTDGTTHLQIAHSAGIAFDFVLYCLLAYLVMACVQLVPYPPKSKKRRARKHSATA